MDVATAETAADPAEIRERLPAAPGRWTRTADVTGTVEYRLASDEGPCTAAKLTVRPDVLGDGGVRVDKTVDCRGVGTDRFDDVDGAAAAVERELDHVLRGLDEYPSVEPTARSDG